MCYIKLTTLSFYPRDAMLARVFADSNVSVRLSVRPSVRHEPVLRRNEES